MWLFVEIGEELPRLGRLQQKDAHKHKHTARRNNVKDREDLSVKRSTSVMQNKPPIHTLAKNPVMTHDMGAEV